MFNLSTDPAMTYTLWTGVIGGAFLIIANHGADQIIVQSYLCARNRNHDRVVLSTSGVEAFFPFSLFLMIGVGLYLFSQSGAWQLPADIRKSQEFGRFIVEKLPMVFTGLVIASVLTVAMSTLSSSLNSSVSAAVADSYKPLRPAKSERQYLQISGLLTLILGITQIAVALCAWHIGSPRRVINQVLSVAGLTTGMVLGLFLLGILKQPISSKAALLGMLFGFSIVTAANMPRAMNKSFVAWPWYAPVGTLYTVLMTLVLNTLRPNLRSNRS